MRAFVLKMLKFAIGFPIALVFMHLFMDQVLNTRTAENSIFIWGDSQAYHGIDLDILRDATGHRIYSTARHGAGVYDLLVFADKVPEQSRVLITLSRPAQIRSKTLDWNRSGISLEGMEILSENGYTRDELRTIVMNNLKPEDLFLEMTHLYPNSDKVLEIDNMDYYEAAYSESPEYLGDKQSIYLAAISILHEKGCDVDFIEFPYHQLLTDLEHRSEVKADTERLKEKISAFYKGTLEFERISVPKDMQAMYDLTHLNERGAQVVTKQLVEIWSPAPPPTVFTVVKDR